MESPTILDIARLEKLYEQEEPFLTNAKEQLHFVINGIINHIEDRQLVRALIEKIRIKSFSSPRRKAEKYGWSTEEAITKASDMVGARVVCNNKEDVYRVAELIQEFLPTEGPPPELQDYIKSPKSSGYRGLHLNFRLFVGDPFPYRAVSCEVQIRTLLQHSWAELNHEDIYKEGDSLPEDFRDRSIDLARLLETADDIASKIRQRVSRARVPPERRPQLDIISELGLVHIFSTAFGRYPADYVVREALNACKEAGLRSLQQVDEVVLDKVFREKMNRAYSNILGLPLSHEEFFVLAPYAVSQGHTKAIAAVREKAKKEKEEMDQRWRNEILFELPENVDEFIEELEAGSIDISQLSDALGTTSECLGCSTDIIDDYAFEEGICDYYDCDSVDGRIVSALVNLGVETGDFDNSRLCAYCGEKERKDN